MAKILVIDDMQDIADNLVYSLKKAGYDATSAYSEEEAIKLLQQNDFASEKARVKEWELFVEEISHKMDNLLLALNGSLRWINDISKTGGQINQKDLDSAVARIKCNLQDLKKLTSRHFKSIKEFNPKPTDISDLIAGIVQDMRKALNNCHIQIKERDNKKLPKIQLTPELFRYIIRELIINSSKNLKSRGNIWLRTGFASSEQVKTANVSENAKYIFVEVQDNGPGIPDEIKMKIFKLGYKQDKSSEGTGFGLFFVKKDVEQHRGRIVEIGSPGDGAKFLILLPIKGAKLEMKEGNSCGQNFSC